MTTPFCAARSTGGDLDFSLLGTDQTMLFDHTQNAIDSNGAAYNLIADPIDSEGQVWELLASGTAGQRGPSIAVGPDHKHLGDPQGNGGLAQAFDQVYVSKRIACMSTGWDTANNVVYIEPGGMGDNSVDNREISERITQNGTFAIVARRGAAVGQPSASAGAGTMPLDEYRQVRTHYRRNTGTNGRLAFQIETGTPGVFGSVVENVTADLGSTTIKRILAMARDAGQNLGANGHPRILFKSWGWYVPFSEIDADLGDEDFWSYCEPTPFDACRTCDVGHDRAKIAIIIPDNVLADSDEATIEFGIPDANLVTGLVGSTIHDPWGLIDEDVNILVTRTATLRTTGLSGAFEEFVNLNPDTYYCYKITAGGVESNWRVFRTAPAPGQRRTLRYVVMTHCHSDGRRQPNVAARRAAELYLQGLIDFVIDGSKWLMHSDNNGTRTPALTIAEMMENLLSACYDPFVAQFLRTGCPVFSVPDDYYGYPTNQGKWTENIEGTVAVGYNGPGTLADLNGDIEFQGWAAGEAFTYAEASALGSQVFNEFFKPGWLVDESLHRFVQMGEVDFVFLHDRETRDPLGGSVFYGEAAIAAVEARILANNGAKVVKIWTPSTSNDIDADAKESWESYPVERADALQRWEDAAFTAGKKLEYEASCKDNPFVAETSVMTGLLSTDRGRIAGHFGIGKSWGRAGSNNTSLFSGANPVPSIKKALILDGSLSLVDPFDGVSRTCVAGDHLGWVPLVETSTEGSGYTRVQILDVINLEPIVDTRYGAFDVTYGLGLTPDASGGGPQPSRVFLPSVF